MVNFKNWAIRKKKNSEIGHFEKEEFRKQVTLKMNYLENWPLPK